jgi:uncharacterized protein YjiK
MIFKKYVYIAIALLSIAIQAQKVGKLKPTKHITVTVPEPSDICYDSKNDTFYMVSDKGIIFETDKDCKVIRKHKQKGHDFEAVYADGTFVYAVDESNRTIYKYESKSFKLVKSTTIPYYGARNKGYESFDFDPINNKFILITESNPIMLFELDADFKVTRQNDLSAIAEDISSARFHNGFLWLLSDEDSMLLKLNASTYEVLQKWSLPLINPEGLVFDKEGNLLIACDDMQRVYYFNNPEKK